MRQSVRPILFAALLLSAIWAAWRLWPTREPEVDFRFKMHTTAQMVLYDPVTDRPMELPSYGKGGFHSAKGMRIAARDVIRYEPAIREKIGPTYTAWFRMAPDTTRGDFMHAVRDIWSVCDADIVVAAHDQEETFLMLAERNGRDCARIFHVDERGKMKAPNVQKAAE